MRRSGSITGNLSPRQQHTKKSGAGTRSSGGIRLDFSSLPLYGRETERQQLLELYHQAALGKSESIVVKGVSGAGKTALVHFALQKAVETTGGFFCEGKFQEEHKRNPYIAIVDALTQLLQDHTSLLDANNIQQALGGADSAQLLFPLIPQLRGICATAAVASSATGSQSTTTDNSASNSHDSYQSAPHNNPNDAYALERFLHLFASLLKAMASQKHPLVIFLDDCHWADASSLRLLSYLMDDAEIKYVLFVVSYRHELEQDILHQLEHPMTPIVLCDLDFDDVNALIASAVGAPIDAVEPLTAVVYRKTGGNCFYVKQFLGMLQDEDYLYYLSHAVCWEYDLDGIVHGTNVAENVAELVVGRLENLESNVLAVLKLASCLGFTFDTKLLFLLMMEEHPELKMDETQLVVVVRVLLKAGLVEQAGSKMQLKFVHDRIQSCAYSMISSGKKLLHLRIGFLLQRLYEQNPYFQQEWVFFSLVDHLNLGSDRIRESSERKFLVQLDLKAGKEAKRRWAFLAAAEYVEFALLLLDSDEQWEEEYDLRLELTSFAAEMYLCAGKLDESKIMANLVLQNAKSMDDKIRMFIVLIQLISATGNLHGGSKMCMTFLKDLGYQLPKRPNAMHVVAAVFAAKRALRYLSNNDILSLPVTTDMRNIVSVKLLTMITSYLIMSQQAKSAYTPICACLVVQSTIKNGLSSESAAGFALFGVIAVVTNSMELAQRYADISLRLLEKFPDVAIQAFVSAVLFSIIRPWGTSLYKSIEAFDRGHQAGYQSETREYGCLNAVQYCLSSFMCGAPLLKLSVEQKRFVGEALELKHTPYALTLSTLRQLTLNALGCAQDPLILTGAALQEEDAEKEAKEHPDGIVRRVLAGCRLELANLLSNYSMVKRLLPEIGKMRSAKAKNHFCFIRESFLAGLGFIQLSRSDWKYKKQARRHLTRFEKWAKTTPSNCKHMHLLLRAQFCSAHSRMSYHTSELYDEAIVAASKAGFKNDEALANELAGEFCKEHADIQKGFTYILCAYQLYKAWGAKIKTEQLKKIHADIGLAKTVASDAEALSVSSSANSIRRRKNVSFAGEDDRPPE